MIGKPAAAFAALLALLALTACGPGSPAPTPTTTGGTATADPDDGATPEPTDTAPDRPTPRFDASCDTLVPASLLTPILPFAFEANDVLRTEYFASPSIPRHGAVAQVGGLLCEWSNGEPYSSETGSSAFRGIQLSVLPDATSGWERFAGYYGFAPTADSVSCFAASGVCSLDVHAGGYWFSAEIDTTVGAGTEAAVRALGDHLQAATSGFGTLREPWYPTGLQVIPSDCDVTLPATLVGSVFGSGHELYEADGGGGWSLWAEAMSRNGGFGCGWYGGVETISISWQPGGAWLARQLGVTSNGAAVDIPALGADGVARLTSYSDGSYGIDLVAHGTWVSTVVNGASDSEAGVRQLANHVAGLFAP
jgi:hypothetical protein